MRAIALFLCMLLSPVTGKATAILALDKDGGRLHVIDRDTFALRASIEVGTGAHEVIASQDGKHAYVALYGDQHEAGHTLVEVDLANASVRKRIDTAPLIRPHGLARAGKNIYFTAEVNRALGRFNPDEGRVDRILGIGRDATHMVEIAADGQQLFTADMLSNSVTRMDFRVKAPAPALTHFQVGDRPEGLALHPDGNQVWVGLNGDGKIQILDLGKGAVVASLDAGSYPARIEFSADGTQAFVIDPQESSLLVFDVDNRSLLHAHHVVGVPLGILPAMEPNRVFLTLSQTGEVVEVDTSTGKVLRRVDVGRVADGIAAAGWK